MDMKTARGRPWSRALITVVLTLAFVAALGMGAAPALAQDGCDCPTAVPPTHAAQAAHAPYLAGVTDCTTCHAGMTVPHTGRSTLAIFDIHGRSIDAGYRLHGQVYDILALGRGVWRANLTVYVQQRAQGETSFTDIGRATTNKFGFFGFTVTSPLPYAYYRGIAQGQIIPGRIAHPVLKILKPRPTLTLWLIGPTSGVLPLGHSITAKVKAKPVQMAGKTVRFTLQRRVAAKWVTRRSVTRTLSAAATCSWTYKPATRGLFRIHVHRRSSADFASAGSGWHRYRVM
jgi:hypothetical protein